MFYDWMICMDNSNLRDKMQEYKRKTGYDKFTPQECKEAADRLIKSLHGFEKYSHEDLEKGYLLVRKGYTHE